MRYFFVSISEEHTLVVDEAEYGPCSYILIVIGALTLILFFPFSLIWALRVTYTLYFYTSPANEICGWYLRVWVGRWVFVWVGGCVVLSGWVRTWICEADFFHIFFSLRFHGLHWNFVRMIIIKCRCFHLLLIWLCSQSAVRYVSYQMIQAYCFRSFRLFPSVVKWKKIINSDLRPTVFIRKWLLTCLLLTFNCLHLCKCVQLSSHV